MKEHNDVIDRIILCYDNIIGLVNDLADIHKDGSWTDSLWKLESDRIFFKCFKMANQIADEAYIFSQKFENENKNIKYHKE